MTQYTRNPPLLESAVSADPLEQLLLWVEDARDAGQIEPTAMTLATVGADGEPSARMVLFKGLYQGGLCFYTNYLSRKGQALAANPRVAVTFWWDRLERQLRVEGRVTPLPRGVSEAYFAGRPRDSQIGAVVSRQSQVVANRAELDARFDQTAVTLLDLPVPCPEHWGGYRIEPLALEFWQGRQGRLHDRLRYRPDGAGGWLIERLEP